MVAAAALLFVFDFHDDGALFHFFRGTHHCEVRGRMGGSMDGRISGSGKGSSVRAEKLKLLLLGRECAVRVGCILSRGLDTLMEYQVCCTYGINRNRIPQ